RQGRRDLGADRPDDQSVRGGRRLSLRCGQALRRSALQPRQRRPPEPAGRRRAAVGSRRRLVPDAWPAHEGGVREPELLRLPDDEHPERRTVQGRHGRRRGGVLDREHIPGVPGSSEPGTPELRTTPARCFVRRLLFALLALPLAYSAAPRASNDLPQSLSVQQHDGTYEVSASFDVPRPIAIVRAVLTDYEHIPKFLPQVERSVVLERTESGVLVDQQAVTQLLMFSKRMHLVLD